MIFNTFECTFTPSKCHGRHNPEMVYYRGAFSPCAWNCHSINVCDSLPCFFVFVLKFVTSIHDPTRGIECGTRQCNSFTKHVFAERKIMTKRNQALRLVKCQKDVGKIQLKL